MASNPPKHFPLIRNSRSNSSITQFRRRSYSNHRWRRSSYRHRRRNQRRWS
uniref:Uncharacterized protein n=1 Tax=Helianthus annuus TaxID=4232 RepID=A0A251T5P1_HELAN